MRVGHHFAFENIAANRQSGPGYAHLHAVRRSTRIECRRDADSTFVSDDSYFDRASVFQDLKLGDNSGLRKIDNVDLVILLVQVLIFDQAYALYKLAQAKKVLGIDKLEQSVCRCSK